jgi:hypothetical protein
VVSDASALSLDTFYSSAGADLPRQCISTRLGPRENERDYAPFMRAPPRNYTLGRQLAIHLS